MLLRDPRQSDQRTQSFHFPIVVHQSLDPAAQSSAQAPSSLFLHALRSSSARHAGSERVDALGLRAVEVIICMITRDFSVISMTSQASLSLSLSLSLSQKSLTHNIGSASALPIIIIQLVSRFITRKKIVTRLICSLAVSSIHHHDCLYLYSVPVLLV